MFDMEAREKKTRLLVYLTGYDKGQSIIMTQVSIQTFFFFILHESDYHQVCLAGRRVKFNCDSSTRRYRGLLLLRKTFALLFAVIQALRDG